LGIIRRGRERGEKRGVRGRLGARVGCNSMNVISSFRSGGHGDFLEEFLGVQLDKKKRLGRDL